jgi:hypothetical protein
VYSLDVCTECAGKLVVVVILLGAARSMGTVDSIHRKSADVRKERL